MMNAEAVNRLRRLLDAGQCGKLPPTMPPPPRSEPPPPPPPPEGNTNPARPLEGFLRGSLDGLGMSSR